MLKEFASSRSNAFVSYFTNKIRKPSSQPDIDKDEITAKYDISTFFLIFTFVPIIIGVIALLLNPVLKKLMHGVK